MPLYHFSEENNIAVFEPRPSRLDEPPLVWAIDQEHAPLYYFPRDCPRAAFGPGKQTTAEDAAPFRAVTRAHRIIAVENRWLQRILDTQLYVYHFATESFCMQDANAGYYVSRESVVPLQVEPVGGLIRKLTEANIELRFTPSLTPIREMVLNRTYDFSLIRMAHAGA
jgi:hypothetical protein